MERIKFKLVQIKTLQFATLAAVDTETKQEVNTELKFGFDASKRQIGVFANFKFFQENNILLTLEVLCVFEIKKASWEALIQNNNLVVPLTVLRHTAMLTIGTSRGVLHTKTENTPYNSIMLPTINLHSMLKEDLIVSIAP